MAKFSILHFSDLHFGDYNIEDKGRYKFSFENYFNIFTDFLDDLINTAESPIKLVLISGDFFTRGVPTESIYFKYFFRHFFNKNIPVLTCLGNHDIIRSEIDLMTQFRNYIDFIESIKNLLGIDKSNGEYLYELSQNFNENQASYVYLND